MTFNNSWPTLDYWTTGEWQWVEEQLDDLTARGLSYNPPRGKLFASLDATPFESVRVVIVGQDPYPDTRFSTGVAFGIGPTWGKKDFPSTLKNIFTEYCNDLHYPEPKTGDLTAWCKQGVLLWNAYPSCLRGNPGSHRWPEWEFLTQEIVKRQSKRGVVFCLLGAGARKLCEPFIGEESEVFSTSHPSPLAAKKGSSKVPAFLGSRLFTSINDLICTNNLGSKIDWRLD